MLIYRKNIEKICIDGAIAHNTESQFICSGILII